MLSRRSVRVKVIQMLYSASRDETLTRQELLTRYKQSIETSYELFLYNLYTIFQVAKVSQEDKEKRASKFIQNEDDKVFTPKIYTNERIQDLENNKAIQKVFDKYNFREKSDKDVFRKIYSDFLKEESYLTYLAKETSSEDDLEILLELFRFCRQNESYNELIEDQFVTWEDDKSLVIGSIKKVLKGLPFGKDDFFKEFFPDDDMVKDFGEMLLLRTFEDDKVLLDYIIPVLNNWHHERVAILDMIMLKLAVTEFLHCPSIPVKVTLNEYVEISKSYSTSKSKDFINGVLDKLSKQFAENGKMVKEGRGLEE